MHQQTFENIRSVSEFMQTGHSQSMTRFSSSSFIIYLGVLSDENDRINPSVYYKIAFFPTRDASLL